LRGGGDSFVRDKNKDKDKNAREKDNITTTTITVDRSAKDKSAPPQLPIPEPMDNMSTFAPDLTTSMTAAAVAAANVQPEPQAGAAVRVKSGKSHLLALFDAPARPQSRAQ
jgi:hypothetical protein